MSFVDVGQKKGPRNNKLVLPTVFSEPLQVFSAEKFPGVIKSTQLSKCFPLQGIKITIRKDS